ncbi:Glutaredoxin family protein [Euphorbia peplus]|nr:Glutaredoxin family protein [Euphorbia peplus]
MGCSASKPTTLLHTKEQHNLPYCSSSPSSLSLEKETSSSSSSSSSYYSCSHCHSQPHPPPVARAFSLQTPLVHHPPSRKGDSHHLVSLTSSTYGSLLLQQPSKNPPFQPQSLPKTTHILKDTSDSPSLSPDSVINTWELMDGLDDDLDLHFQLGNPKAASFHHMGSDCSTKKLNACFDTAKSDEIDKPVPLSNSKPLWKHLSEESFLSNMDPNVVSSYRRALSSRQLGGKVYSFTKDSKSLGSVGSSPMNNKNGVFKQNPDEKIVVYFTSLRGIRKTYEDCNAVRMILRGFRVPVDERDISMDSSYRKELQSLLKGKAMRLPQVFVRGENVGGVDEIRQLNEAGELGNLFEGFPVKDLKMVCECENCGDARFVPCSNCNGSRKVFDFELRRCPDCNENGLVRCSSCC